MFINSREIYKENELIALIGQDSEGIIYKKVLNDKFNKIVNSFITPIKAEIAINEGDVSVSVTKILLLKDLNWLGNLEYNLPEDYYATPVMKIDKKNFD